MTTTSASSDAVQTTTAAAVASAVVAMVSFQLGASIAKTLIPVIGAPGTTALRLGLSALIVIVVQRPWRSVPSRRAWPVVLAYGICLGAMNSVFYLSLRTIPLGIAVAIEFVGPLSVAVLASRRRLDYLWVLLAAGGLSILLPITKAGSRLDPAGVLYALAAGVGWALYIVFGQKAGRAHGPSASTWGLIIAAIIATPIGIVTSGSRMLGFDVLPRGFGVAVLSSAFPYTLEMIALRRLSAKTFGTLMSFEPAIAAIAGVTLLGEHLALLQYLAICAIIVASIGAVAGEAPAQDAVRADFAP